MNTGFLGPAVATVLTVYGIETVGGDYLSCKAIIIVATVLTVYGIETHLIKMHKDIPIGLLQQYLPFTVLKRTKFLIHFSNITCFRCNSTYRLRYLIEYMTKPRED